MLGLPLDHRDQFTFSLHSTYTQNDSLSRRRITINVFTIGVSSTANLRATNSRLEAVQLGGAQLSVVVPVKLLDEMLCLGAVISELGLQNLRRF